jgi:hypothetical protein
MSVNNKSLLHTSRWLSSGLLRRVVWWKFTDVAEVLAASIGSPDMLEAASTSEKSANFYQTTWRNNPEDDIFILATVRT